MVIMRYQIQHYSINITYITTFLQLEGGVQNLVVGFVGSEALDSPRTHAHGDVFAVEVPRRYTVA